MNTLSRSLAILALAMSITAPMAHAEGDGAIDAATQAKITTELTAQGYDVRKIDQEDGMIEVYAVKDGKTFELYLDSNLKIVRSSQD